MPVRPAEILALGEAGADETWARRAAMLLALAWPDDASTVPENPGLGERDAWLLDLRARTLGPTLRAVVMCPTCGGELVVTADIEALRFEQPVTTCAGARALHLTIDDHEVHARTPDARALEAAAATTDVAAARTSLVSACIVRASGPDGEPVEPGRLPQEVLRNVGERLVELDPQSEVRLGVGCVECGHSWEPVLDIARLLWAELEAIAVRLTDEVDVLATSYGWSERAILKLSPTRRHRYVRRVLDKERDGARGAAG